MMRKPLRQVISVVLLTIIPNIASRASENTDDVYSWLNKMSQAMTTKSFKGTFVYQGHDGMVAMKILRIADQDGPRERLISLNGAQGEVIRDHKGVTCKLPNANLIVLDKRGIRKVLPVKGFNVSSQTSSFYKLSMEDAHQVAGRNTRIVNIIPTDNLRYGYRVWLDKETGLLLKSQSIDASGKVLEQLMYTSVDIYDDVPDTLNQAMPLQATLNVQEKTAENTEAVIDTIDDATVAGVGDYAWQVDHLPTGFTLAEYHKEIPDQDKKFEHLVYTDGLASVSIFIEKNNKKPSFIGASRIGAVTAFGSMIDEHQVTVVGEVPLETLQMMSNSIRYASVAVH